MLESGTVLHQRYQIESILGRGGMGAVYLARDATLGGKRVAVKELQNHIDDPEDRARAVAQFIKEAEILASLDHPGIVHVTHYFEEGKSQYLVMAFIEGQTLDGIVRIAPSFLDVSHVLQWADQLCDVLEYLHSQVPPIIFRDLKPANIMLNRRGHIRLIDFGIARIFDDHTQTATLIKGAGTPGFAPVEQYGSSSTDPRSDVYSLGATLYVLLTRILPPVSVSLLTEEEQLYPPASINPAVSPHVSAVIMGMLGLRREDRYQSIAEAQSLAVQQRASGPRSKPGG